jgi:transcriptional regulator with XRE-family HTH domain
LEKSTHSRLYEPVLRRLRALRKDSGATIRELARLLGRDTHLVWRIEHRERRIDILEFFWYCRACGADPEKEAARLMRELKKVCPGAGSPKPRRKRSPR